MSKCQISVFLNHASEDKLLVRKLYRKLKKYPWIDPWLDEKKISPGQDWDLEIEKAIQNSDAFIACLSNNSVDKIGVVQEEIQKAEKQQARRPKGWIYTIPILLDDCEVPYNFGKYHWVKIFETGGFEKLLESLEKNYKIKCKKKPPIPAPNSSLVFFDTSIDNLISLSKNSKIKLEKKTGYIKPVIEIHNKSKEKIYIASQENLSASDFKKLLNKLSPSCVIFSGTAYSLKRSQQSLRWILISTEITGYKISSSKVNKQVYKVPAATDTLKASKSLVEDFSKQGKNKFKKLNGHIWVGSDLPENHDFRNQFIALNTQSIGISKLNLEFINLLNKKKTPWIIVKASKGEADGKPIDRIIIEGAWKNSLKLLINSNLNFSKNQNR